MLRITSLPTAESETALRLEGHIAGPWLEPLQAACTVALASGRRVTLDLADVSLIDRPALALLRSLAARGVVLTRCSAFQEAQLKQAATLP